MIEGRKAGPLGPESRATRLAPRALSAGVVDSLGEGFVCRLCHGSPIPLHGTCATRCGPGLLDPILSTIRPQDERPRTQGPEPSAARLASRALSTGVVDSLGEGFV